MTRYLVLAVLLFALAACLPAPDNLATVSEFQKHKNGGDVDSVMKLFADQPSLHFGTLGTISGLTNVRNILEYDLALNTHLQFQGCESVGPQVSCRVVESNDWLNTVDIESITYDENRFAFTADGRIQSVSSTMSAESGQMLGAAMAEFHEWATTHRPAAYGDLFSDEGNFVYTRDSAEKVLALLRIWRSK